MRTEILAVLLASLILAFFISPFASTWPDGLERVAGDKGFLEKGEGWAPFNSPIPDYLIPGIKDERLATGLAGLLGVFVVFAATYGVTLLVKKK